MYRSQNLCFFFSHYLQFLFHNTTSENCGSKQDKCKNVNLPSPRNLSRMEHLPEVHTDKLIILDNRPQQVIGYILDRGRVPLVYQPGEDSRLISEAARVEVGYTVLVID